MSSGLREKVSRPLQLASASAERYREDVRELKSRKSPTDKNILLRDVSSEASGADAAPVDCIVDEFIGMQT